VWSNIIELPLGDTSLNSFYNGSTLIYQSVAKRLFRYKIEKYITGVMTYHLESNFVKKIEKYDISLNKIESRR
jgi:hypothetical protein